MDELINANYIADIKSIGRKDKLLSITICHFRLILLIP